MAYDVIDKKALDNFSRSADFSLTSIKKYLQAEKNKPIAYTHVQWTHLLKAV
jgi:hypothetical protein